MSRTRQLAIAIVSCLLILGGCGDGGGVGKDIDLDKIQGGKTAGPRLGEDQPSPSAAAPSPTPQKTQAAPPPPSPAGPKPAQAFEVTLTNASPYYAPAQALQVPVGTLIRFTNQDSKNRAPYVEGLFESPVLKTGESFEYLANQRTGGAVPLNDRIATFKGGSLEVY